MNNLQHIKTQHMFILWQVWLWLHQKKTQSEKFTIAYFTCLNLCCNKKWNDFESRQSCGFEIKIKAGTDSWMSSFDYQQTKQKAFSVI